MHRYTFSFLGATNITPPTEEQIQAASEPYLKALGKVVFAWNQMQERLALLFVVVGQFKNEHIATAIWHSTPSDLSQRKMLRAAAVESGGEDNAKMADIIWMLNKIDDELGHRRNEAIHAAYHLVTDTGNQQTRFGPDDWSANPKSRKLEGRNLLAEFEWLAECSHLLADYARRMELHLIDDDAPQEGLHDSEGNELYAWPEKPSLPRKPDKSDPTKPPLKNSQQ